jgi:predicted nucleic acid-binding protein
MGIVIDSSLFIAAERGRFDWVGFHAQLGSEAFYLTVITLAELMHGAARADSAKRRAMRTKYIEDVEARYPLLTFGREEALEYSKLWAEMSARGTPIGTHDLQIAAIARRFGYRVATLNRAEFCRVSGLDVVDAGPFRVETTS